MDRLQLHNLVSKLKEKSSSFEHEGISRASVDALTAQTRFSDDGIIDCSSVSTSLKYLCQVLEGIEFHEVDANKGSIRDIQLEYFNYLERILEEPLKIIRKSKLSPGQAASLFAQQHDNVQVYHEQAPDIELGIHRFWRKFSQPLLSKVESLQTMKAIYGGGLFPAAGPSGALPASVLYCDTLVLPCPLLKCSNLYRFISSKEGFRLLLKHSLAALNLKELALLDLEIPVVVICPQYYDIDDSVREFVTSQASTQLIAHFGKALGVNFDSNQHLQNFLAANNDPVFLEKITSVDLDRLLYEEEYTGLSLVQRCEKERIRFADTNLPKVSSLSDLLQFKALGKLAQANDLVLKSCRLGGLPLVTNEAAWKNLVWRYEYEDKTGAAADVFALNSLKGDSHHWLSNLSIKDLLHLRSEGALEDIRKLLRCATKEISECNTSNYQQLVNATSEELKARFKEHAQQITAIHSSQAKFWGVDLTLAITSGILGFASISNNSANISMISALLAVVGGKGICDLLPKWQELTREEKRLKGSAIGILFQAHEEQFKR